MKTVTKKKAIPAKDLYLALVMDFPLRPIRTAERRDAAQPVLDRLAVRGEDGLAPEELDYLDVLTDLVEAYDREHHPMPTRQGTPRERLAALMDFSETTPKRLESILGLSQTAVSLILAGKRGLSKKSIAKLAEHFRLSADYFL